MSEKAMLRIGNDDFCVTHGAEIERVGNLPPLRLWNRAIAAAPDHEERSVLTLDEVEMVRCDVRTIE